MYTEEYRRLKESFVQGYGGGTVAEVGTVLTFSFLCLVLSRVASPSRPASELGGGGGVGAAARFACEFALGVVPMVLVYTVFSNFSALATFSAVVAVVIAGSARNAISRSVRYAGGIAPSVPSASSPAPAPPSPDDFSHAASPCCSSPKPADPHYGTSRGDGGGLRGTFRVLGNNSLERECRSLLNDLRSCAFVDDVRAVVIMLTVLGILAVDFPAFPRRFAKTEFYGTSGMDAGVGLFVLLSGMSFAISHARRQAAAAASIAVLGSSRKARKATDTSEREFSSHVHNRRRCCPRFIGRVIGLWKGALMKFTVCYRKLCSFFTVFIRLGRCLLPVLCELRRVAPLLVIAALRIVLLKSIGYQLHASEYGVHWNFFVTLAALPVLATIFGISRTNQELNQRNILLLSFVIMAVHEFLLICGLEKYTRLHERTENSNLIVLNCEGLLSLPGYLVLYLIGMAFGNQVAYMARSGGRLSGWLWIALQYAFSLLATLSCYGLSKHFLGPASRVVVNVTYISYTLCLWCLICFLSLCSYLLYPSPTGTIAYGISKNMLVIFLISNLLTGLVNLTIDTLSAGAMFTVFILLLYCGVVFGVAFNLGNQNKTVKLFF
ncbi:phosphatidylinositol glycan, class W [Pelomyxa schiedti]|nr:phosphatidylinositol glycan, class W [Pelomyxa schiedti]